MKRLLMSGLMLMCVFAMSATSYAAPINVLEEDFNSVRPADYHYK